MLAKRQVICKHIFAVNVTVLCIVLVYTTFSDKDKYDTTLKFLQMYKTFKKAQRIPCSYQGANDGILECSW